MKLDCISLLSGNALQTPYPHKLFQRWENLCAKRDYFLIKAEEFILAYKHFVCSQRGHSMRCDTALLSFLLLVIFLFAMYKQIFYPACSFILWHGKKNVNMQSSLVKSWKEGSLFVDKLFISGWGLALFFSVLLHTITNELSKRGCAGKTLLMDC